MQPNFPDLINFRFSLFPVINRELSQCGVDQACLFEDGLFDFLQAGIPVLLFGVGQLACVRVRVHDQCRVHVNILRRGLVLIFLNGFQRGCEARVGNFERRVDVWLRTFFSQNRLRLGLG